MQMADFGMGLGDGHDVMGGGQHESKDKDPPPLEEEKYAIAPSAKTMYVVELSRLARYQAGL